VCAGLLHRHHRPVRRAGDLLGARRDHQVACLLVFRVRGHAHAHQAAPLGDLLLIPLVVLMGEAMLVEVRDEPGAGAPAARCALVRRRGPPAA